MGAAAIFLDVFPMGPFIGRGNQYSWGTTFLLLQTNLISFSPKLCGEGEDYEPHLTGEETEAQEVSVNCPREHGSSDGTRIATLVSDAQMHTPPHLIPQSG